jgi:hypothetical protein
MGVYAQHTIDEFLTLPENCLLYAPTLRPPDPCPLEVGVKYWEDDEPFLFVYDHYLGIFTDVDFTADELRDEHYLTLQDTYDVCIIWQDNTWGAYLYDYNDNLWDRIYNQDNNKYLYAGGWDTYEVYFDSSWPSDTNYLKASNIMIYTSNGYEPIQWYWDYNWGTWYSGPGYELANWPGGFNVPHGWVNNFYEWWAGVENAYPSNINWADTFAGGYLENADGLLGPHPDGNCALLLDGYYNSGTRIVADMNTEATGEVYVYCYSEPGYMSDLYVYVSSDNYNWDQVGEWIPAGIGQTSPQWYDIGHYSGTFTYIAICGYYYTGDGPVYLYVDAVRVDP